MREPLTGVDAVCPVSPDTRVAILSPRRAVEAFVHAHELSAEAWGEHRSLNDAAGKAGRGFIGFSRTHNDCWHTDHTPVNKTLAGVVVDE